MSVKFSYQTVKLYFEERGCKLLETEYVDCFKKMRYICECGAESVICFKKFKDGRRCKDCGKRKIADAKRYSFDEVRKYFEDHGCELLDTTYIDSQTKLKYRCVCGELSSIRFNNFKNGNRCVKCGIIKSSEQRKHSLETVRDYFSEQGCILLDDQYINASKLLNYQCICGKVSKISYSSFLNGNRCKDCGIKKSADTRRYTIEEVKQIFKDAGALS